MQHQLVKVDKNGEINDESYRVNVRGAEIEQQKAMVAIVASLFMYIAFILISAVGTILAVQSLSDSTKYKYRYLTLRRLGINDKSLFKTIRKQLLILFCVPAISAILCSFVMMSSLNNVDVYKRQQMFCVNAKKSQIISTQVLLLQRSFCLSS